MRLPRSFARAASFGAAAAVVAVAVAGGALAQPSRRLEITSAPKIVGLKQTFKIEARFQGGIPGEHVVLQRWSESRGWADYASRRIDDSNETFFWVRKPRISAPYRLTWRDLETGESARSESVRVAVRPLMRFDVRPDDVYQGRSVRIKGGLWPEVKKVRRVALQQRVRGDWTLLRKVRIRNGRFSTRLTAGAVGNHMLRAVFKRDGLNSSIKASEMLRVYEPDLATWYGPGLYGNGTACGQRLTPGMLGVAHRTLPCGTKVSLMYGGRTITVRVIDRGPYSAAEWDLTEATARRLGFSGTDEVGATR